MHPQKRSRGWKMTLQASNSNWKIIARSHEYYIEATKHCSEEWDRIMSLQQKEVLSDEDRATLDRLRQKFDLVLSADFQMQKLVPYWGLTPQTWKHLLSSET